MYAYPRVRTQTQILRIGLHNVTASMIRRRYLRWDLVLISLNVFAVKYGNALATNGNALPTKVNDWQSVGNAVATNGSGLATNDGTPAMNRAFLAPILCFANQILHL